MPKGKKTPSPAEDFIAPSAAGEMPALEDIAKQGQVGELADVVPYSPHVDILDQAGHLVRTYSLEMHGENFSDLADQYIAGHPSCTRTTTTS